jgi:hypothetical protein
LFLVDPAEAADKPRETCASGVRVARGIVFGAAVGGAVMVTLGHVAGERHVPARDLQEVAALGGIAHPLGRPQALFGHSLVFFTRRHGHISAFLSRI